MHNDSGAIFEFYAAELDEMAKKKIESRSFDDVIAALRQHGFDVAEVPGVANRVVVRKHGCGALLERTSEKELRIVGKPMCIIGGEMATLEDRGYQKFLVTEKLTIAATSDHLRTLHEFTEELNEITGETTFYNEALGTTSDRYMYDRVKGRV
jgi:hypothetical protein